jgi:hypothetical protein
VEFSFDFGLSDAEDHPLGVPFFLQDRVKRTLPCKVLKEMELHAQYSKTGVRGTLLKECRGMAPALLSKSDPAMQACVCYSFILAGRVKLLALRRLLLERMQHINRMLELDRVHGPVRVAAMVRDDFRGDPGGNLKPRLSASASKSNNRRCRSFSFPHPYVTHRNRQREVCLQACARAEWSSPV